uniref:Uncharacterized protein n=1 Tax=Lepeophtheirus salmonis TaxID=72036 RepID=A0A0K2T4G2_LEPSM
MLTLSRWISSLSLSPLPSIVRYCANNKLRG